MSRKDPKRPRVVCPVCGRHVGTYAHGRIVWHDLRGPALLAHSDAPQWPRCPGYDQYPEASQ